ncbi:hypothetical protein VZT92_010760 [Zoarces viviparus]
MGNQQCTKNKQNLHGHTESRDALPKSPRLQIPWKRRRRVEGLVYSGGFQHNLKTTPGTQRAPPKANRLTELTMTSSPTFGVWDFEEVWPMMCTPAAQRKRVTGKERVSSLERNRSRQELKPTWRVKLPDALSASFNQKRGLFSEGRM